MFELGVITAIIVGLGELYKQLELPKRYLPLTNLILGIIAGLVFMDGTLAEQIFIGIGIGLASSGLYDQSYLVSKKN